MTSENPDIPELEPLGVVVDLCALEAEIEKTRAELVGAPGARAETMLPRVQILDEGSRQLLVSIARLVALAQGRERPDRDLDAFERWLRHDVFTPANSVSLAARLIAAKAAKTDPDLERLGRFMQERVDKAVEQMKAIVPFIRRRFQVAPSMSAAEIILAAAKPQAPAALGRLLVVEDDRDSRELLVQSLEACGHAVTAVESCEKAWALLSADDRPPFDVIVADVFFGSAMSGVELLQRVTGHERLRLIPVILVSGQQDPELIRSAIAAGADDFLPKPINEPLLLARIAKSLRLRLRERAFRLLESLFPGRFLNTYLALGTVPPTSHEHVGVLFSDIVGFTEFSRNRRPEYVVGCLQRHVEHFEEAGVRHGVQKIKTIGDAYMGAVGLEGAVDRPAHNLVRFSEDVLRRIRASGSDFRVRIGIHVGPVTTGLLGRSRFTFDLWGETVNLAARMEQYGVPDRITLSEAASKQIADWAEFSDPPRIEDIHNVGRVPVFDFHRWTPAAPDD